MYMYSGFSLDWHIPQHCIHKESYGTEYMKSPIRIESFVHNKLAHFNTKSNWPSSEGAHQKECSQILNNYGSNAKYVFILKTRSWGVKVIPSLPKKHLHYSQCKFMDPNAFLIKHLLHEQSRHNGAIKRQHGTDWAPNQAPFNQIGDIFWCVNCCLTLLVLYKILNPIQPYIICPDVILVRNIVHFRMYCSWCLLFSAVFSRIPWNVRCF